MRPLLKMMAVFVLLFAVLFVFGRVLGILSIDKVKLLLEWANQVNPWALASLIIALLFVDLLVSVPTLIVVISAGYFLGFLGGLTTALVGMLLAVLTGYILSRFWGQKLIETVVRKPSQREDLRSSFEKNGPMMIILSRAVPMLPEVTACLAGATHMRFLKFLACVLAGAIPYAIIATYAGSVSSFENPKPALYAVLIFYVVSWSAWAIRQYFPSRS